MCDHRTTCKLQASLGPCCLSAVMEELPPDPYQVLQISWGANTAAIRSANRNLMLKCHPDRVTDPALKASKQDEFQRVQNAYKLLMYDREIERYKTSVRLRKLRMESVKTAAFESSPQVAREESPHYMARVSLGPSTTTPSRTVYSFTFI